MNFKELDELIKSGNGVVSLSEDVVLQKDEEDIFKQGIEIDADNLVIDGNNHMIDAKCKTRIFNIISGEKITIKNISLKNAHSNDGGAILNESKLYLENCEFSQNHSESKGGAITNNACLRISDCTFSNNKSNSSGSVAYNSKNTFFECRFSEFSSNVSRMSAGVICGEENSDISIFVCDFHDEDKNIVICHEWYDVEATSADVYKNGSLIEGSFIDNSVFRGSDFSVLKELLDDSADEIILQQNFELKDSETDIFKEGIEITRDNLVVDGNGHRISANFKSRIFKVTADNVTFRNIEFCNGKSENGGAVYSSSGSVRFENCKFSRFTADNDGGAVYGLKGKICIKNCYIEECMAYGSGGVLYLEDCELEISGSDIGGNQARGRGGAVCSKGEKVTVKNSEFTFNRAPNGGVFCIGSCSAENCVFDNNYSRSGGAVLSDWFCSKNPSGFHFKDCEFSANRVNYELAYSSFDAVNIHLYDCKLSDELFEYNYGVSKVIDRLVIFPPK